MSVFWCPVCATPLEQTGDRLRCPSGHRYPIVDGIPRFLLRESAVPTRSLVSFNFQYGRHSWIYDYDRRRARWIFAEIFGIAPSDIEGKRVCVVGCGNGCEVAAMLDHEPERVVGFDLTDAIADAVSNTGSDPRVHIAQADALAPPVQPASCDVVYSDGVMPHATDPHAFLRALLTLRKADGVLYLRTLVDHPGDATWQQLPRRAIRSVSSRLPAALWWHLCFVIACLIKVPIVGRVLTRGMFYVDRETDSSLRATQLMNFRRFGDHEFRHRISVDQLRAVLSETVPEEQIAISGPILIVDGRKSD